MDIKIKHATIDDLKDIQSLNLALFENEYARFDDTLDCKWTFSDEGKEYFKKRLTHDDYCVFVAYTDNKVVGYLAGSVEEGSYRIVPKYAELNNMFVLNEYRGMKIGTMLCRAFADWCNSKGIKRLRVVASAKNTDGIDFYRKNGFFEHEVVLEKDL